MVNVIKSALVFSVLVMVFCTIFIPSALVFGAPLPVDLQLNGSGSEPWSIENIDPGDSGVKLLTIRNAGNTAGLLKIWVSDIVDSQWTDFPPVSADPSESPQLSRHLLLSPLINRLSTNMNLPQALINFPQSANDNKWITVSPISAGETIDIIWQWQLPAAVGNAVQGKKLTFSISYLLLEMPVVPVDGGGSGGGIGEDPGEDNGETDTPPGSASTFIVTSPEKQMTLMISEDATIAETQTVNVISDRIILSFERGTRIITGDNSIPTELRVTIKEKEEEPPLPDGIIYIGSVYEMIYYVGGMPVSVSLSQPARLILNYNLMSLPPGVKSLFLATYDRQLGWIQLDPVSGFVVEEGQLGALVNHFSIFSILAEVEPEEPVITSPPVTTPVITSPIPSLLPARFEMNSLALSVKEVKSGDPVTIKVQITNIGSMSGEHLLILKVNGLFVDSKYLRLAPGQNRNVSFIISPYAPGVYEIEVNGLRDTLVILGNTIDDNNNSWWPVPAIPILSGLAGLSLILSLIRYFSRKQKS
jgi:hypothetical protein